MFVCKMCSISLCSIAYHNISVNSILQTGGHIYLDKGKIMDGWIEMQKIKNMEKCAYGQNLHMNLREWKPKNPC